jgi:hypothetical protein
VFINFSSKATSILTFSVVRTRLAGRAFQPELIGVLENLANRGYTDGFYQRHHTHEQQNYITGYFKTYIQLISAIDNYRT